MTQYLAGVPDLLRRYAGQGGDPYGQAAITAAVDATRLGHAAPIPAALIQEGAIGYLTATQRTRDIANWRDTALDWACAELKGAVRALDPVPPPTGTGIAGYQVADYLHQHGRRNRADQLGPPALWDALAAHTSSASDLTRLGMAARDRGLYRHAAILWSTAVSHRSPDAARHLIKLLREVRPSDVSRAVRWAARHTTLQNPRVIAWLLSELQKENALQDMDDLGVRASTSCDCSGNVTSLLWKLGEMGADDAVRVLANRAAELSPLDSAEYVTDLLQALNKAGAEDATIVLLNRGPARHVNLTGHATRGVSRLLRDLHREGDADSVTTLAERVATQFSVAGHVIARHDDVFELLTALHEVGADDAATALAERAAAQCEAHESLRASGMLAVLNRAGAQGAVTALADRIVAEVNLDDATSFSLLYKEMRRARAIGAASALTARALAEADPSQVSWMLSELYAGGPLDGADDAVTALLARDPVAHVRLDDPWVIARLLRGLGHAGAEDAITALLARDPAAHVRLDDPSGIRYLLRVLRDAGAEGAVTALLARDPAAHVRVDGHYHAVTELLETLRECGTPKAVRTLAVRIAENQSSVADPFTVLNLLRALRQARAYRAASTLASRAAEQCPLAKPMGSAWLLQEIRATGPREKVSAMAARAASSASLSEPQEVAILVNALHEAGAIDQVSVLANRAAAHAALSHPRGVADLLKALHQTGARDATDTLAHRAADAGMFHVVLEACPDAFAAYKVGQEPNGKPSSPWMWHPPHSRPGTYRSRSRARG